MPKKSVIRYDATGQHRQEIEISQEQADREAQEQQTVKAETVELTRAQQRLVRLVTQSQPVVEDIEVEGEAWFPKRLDWPSLTLYELDSKDVKIAARPLTRTTIALLFHGLAANAHEPESRYFETIEEARDFVTQTAPAVKRQVGALFAKLLEMNPDALNVKAKKN